MEALGTLVPAVSSWLEQQMPLPAVSQCLALRTFEDTQVEVGTLDERGLWRSKNIQPCLCAPNTPVLGLGEEDGGATQNRFLGVSSPTSVLQSGKTEFWPWSQSGYLLPGPELLPCLSGVPQERLS